MLRLALLGLVLSVLPVTAQECRTNTLGDVICRDLPGDTRPRARPAIPLEDWSASRPDGFIPSTREDAFGRIRPAPGGRFDSPRLGQGSRPGSVQLPCRSDAFGNMICP